MLLIVLLLLLLVRGKYVNLEAGIALECGNINVPESGVLSISVSIPLICSKVLVRP